ncbi:LipA and NB-ARC domain-containing protein [Colletotrichum orchidophilum]|uniref:LipA and NB-ARC domain-containing protein n=1 Tax=Colletotrichum orchidophilum TaxID=1209926 RepID=A0A1G4BSG4_9PEZI|nr:LipA and NB-ARC domain-containing protein [Colletotrichum orchidophilum]OHF04402.1 LipA and NB-ARC domain-containing protein [Colletotrichum orchidophilum]
MTKVTPLVLVLLAFAHVTPALSFYIPPFLNYTNSTNTTYHTPKPPAPVDVSITDIEVDKDAWIWGESSGPSFYRGSRKWEDQICGASSFAGITRPTSPLTTDCLALADDAEAERYVWYADGFADNNNTILGIRTHGTCKFGIRPPYADALPHIMTGWYVGGVDVAEVVRTAVRDYDAGGLTGASGMMHCWANRQNHVDVQWAIYGPGEQAEAGWFWAPPVPSVAVKRGVVSTGVGSINKQIARYEITAVFTHPDATVDIVLVHGLNGHPKSTWTSSPSQDGGDVFWPTDLLPHSLGKTRANILVYGYNADVYTSGKSDRSASDNFIFQHAQTLVTNLTLYRKSERTSRNPIIFVAHSLGGILVKRALLYSNDLRDKNQEDARSIFVSTFGIIFLGTPHTGSDMATWGIVLQKMADAIAPKKVFESESVLLKTLKKDNENLQNINSHFLDVYQRFKIHMAHENHKTDVKGTMVVVVDASSASPQLPGVTYYGIEAAHSGMCKFDSSSAPGYRNVSTAIQTWAEEASPVIRARWDIELDDRRARTQYEASEMTREYRKPAETVFSEYRDIQTAQQSSPVDTANTRCASISDSAHQVLNSGPHFVHPDRFRPNSFFKGRTEELESLHKLLKDPRRRSEGTSAVLIHGIPGAGKTHLARQYCFSHKEQYPGGTYWIRSTTLQDMEDGFWRIAKTEAIRGMAVQGKTKDLLNPQNMVDIVRSWFNESKDWLLVFDGIRFNDDAVLRYIPDRPNSSIIYTSTERCDPGSYLLDNPSIMKLGLLPVQDAQELLLEEMGKKQPYTTDDLRRAQDLVQLMDRLPLMIHAAALQMNATREPLAKYLKTFRDSPKVGILPAYKAIRDQLQTRGNSAALNLIYILSFFSQFMPVELLTLGLRALDKRTPVKTETTRGRRSLTQTFVTLISFALIERNETDDISSASSQCSHSGVDASPETLDTLRVHSVVQTFFIELLAEEGQLHFWLERAIRVFCTSFDEAYARISGEPDTGLPEDYRQYSRHGRKLRERLIRYANDRSSLQSREQLSSQTGSVDLVAARKDLEERLARLPADLNELQRTVSTRIIDGKEAGVHTSVFERMNSLSSHSTDASGAAVFPHSAGAYPPQVEHDYESPLTMDNPHHFHMPYVPYVDEQASPVEYQGSEDRTITPYPPDIEEGPYPDTAGSEWTTVTRHRSVRRMSLRRYHDRGGAWRETATATNDPRVSISRESARGLITPPQSSRGGRSPSRSKVSARSEAEAELLHIKKGSPPPPRGGGLIHDKGRSSSAGTPVGPNSVLGNSSYAKVVSGTAAEETSSFPVFTSPPSRAGTLDRAAAYDARSVYSLQTVNSRTPSTGPKLKENQLPKTTGFVNSFRPTESSHQSQGQESVPQPYFQRMFRRMARSVSGTKRHEKSAQGKIASRSSSTSSAPRSSEELSNTYQEGVRTANSSPGPNHPQPFPHGLSIVTNQQSSLRQHPVDHPVNHQPLYTSQDESYNKVVSRSDPSLDRRSPDVSSLGTMGNPPSSKLVSSSTYLENYRPPGSPANPTPPNGYSSQPMSRNPSSNPRYAAATGSAGTLLSSNSGSVRSSLPHRRAPSMVETEPSPRLSPIEMDQTSYDIWNYRQNGRPIDETLFGNSNMPSRLPIGHVPNFIRESPTISPQRLPGNGEPMSRSGSGGIRTTDGRVISFGEIPVNVEEAERRRIRADHHRLQRRYEEAVELSQQIRPDEADPESPPESNPIGLGLRME